MSWQGCHKLETASSVTHDHAAANGSRSEGKQGGHQGGSSSTSAIDESDRADTRVARVAFNRAIEGLTQWHISDGPAADAAEVVRPPVQLIDALRGECHAGIPA